jgi:ParB/RepB/Spo0J family partition protein
MTETKSVENFLKIVEPYCKSKTTSGDSIGIILKDEVVSDPDTLIELQIEAKKIGAKCTTTPPGFRVFLAASNGNSENVDSYMLLHIDDFEEGGPQPRTKILPTDPETVKTFASIEAKGQLDPIMVYPSPDHPNKFRIFDGHRRYMIIFKMLMRTTIKAVCVHISEQEAHENALLLNDGDNRQNLSAYDKGHYIVEVLMKRFSYPSQDALAKKLGMSPQALSYVLLAYNEVANQKSKIDPEMSTRVEGLSERVITHVRHAPEDLKVPLLETAAKKELSVLDTKQLVDRVKEIENATATTVETVADQIIAEKTSKEQVAFENSTEIVAKFLEEGEKLQRQNDRAIDKLIEQFGPVIPEKLITAVYGSFGVYGSLGDVKFTPEKFQSFMHTVIGIMLNNSDIDAVLLEASKWR